jgi:ubiquinone/menaquinone biosynthesis C-methylase UbiE
MKKLGKFGAQVAQYEKGRRNYSAEVFKYIKKLNKIKNPLILDLGCGTGISSRQLLTVGKVIGCDLDPIMLKAAKRHKTIKPIKYIIGKANNLPFKNSTFDIVTTFAAFHWFHDRKSISEIKRVLKPAGKFFVVNKTGIMSWGKNYRKAIMKSIGQPIAEFGNKNFQPDKILRANGFKEVEMKIWQNKEIFTLANALEYVQSISIWNSVPKNKRELALAGLNKYFSTVLKRKGKIERRLNLKVVSGINN